LTENLTEIMEKKLYLEKPNKEGLCPIMWSVTFKGRARLKTGRKCTQKEFESGSFEKKTANILDGQKLLLEDIEYEAQKSGIILTREFIESKFYSANPQGVRKSLWEFWEEWASQQKKKVSKVTKKAYSSGTIKQYENTLQHLKDFEVECHYPMKASTLNEEFYQKFQSYIIIEKEQNTNTHSKYIKNLKTFCRWLKKKDPTLCPDWVDFERTEIETDAEPLNEAEVAKLWAADYSEDPALEKGILIFLGLMSFGVHISDWNEKIRNIKDFSQPTIQFQRYKNTQPCIVPMFDDLNFRPIFIINKLKEKYGEIHYMTGDQLRGYLSYIAADLSLTRIPLTPKTGRITYASIKEFVYKIPSRIIMKTTGHKTERAYRRYLGASHDDIVSANKEKANFVKAG
jgi:hypothetical protein